MKRMSDYNKFTAMLASEFHRYLMEDEEKAGLLPDNAVIIFQVEGEEDFNRADGRRGSADRAAKNKIGALSLIFLIEIGALSLIFL